MMTSSSSPMRLVAALLLLLSATAFVQAESTTPFTATGARTAVTTSASVQTADPSLHVCWEDHGQNETCDGEPNYFRCAEQSICEDIGEGESTKQLCLSNGHVLIEIYANTSTCEGEVARSVELPADSCISLGEHIGILSCQLPQDDNTIQTSVEPPAETLSPSFQVCWDDYGNDTQCGGDAEYRHCAPQNMCEDIGEGEHTMQVCLANGNVLVEVYENTTNCEGEPARTHEVPSDMCIPFGGHVGMISCVAASKETTTAESMPATADPSLEVCLRVLAWVCSVGEVLSFDGVGEGQNVVDRI